MFRVNEQQKQQKQKKQKKILHRSADDQKSLLLGSKSTKT